MYAFRPPNAKERTKAVVLKSLPFSHKEGPDTTATVATVAHKTTPKTAPIAVKRFEDDDKETELATNEPYALVKPKLRKMQKQWTVVGLGDSYHTFYARRMAKGRRCMGDWKEIGSIHADLPRLIVSTCPQMSKTTATSMLKAYFRLYALIELMHIDETFIFHLKRYSGRFVPMESAKEEAFNANACAASKAPAEFVKACVHWLLMLEDEMHRFQEQSSPSVYQMLTRYGLSSADCLRTTDASMNFTNDMVLATQLFFQFLSCYTMPFGSGSYSDTPLVRPLPWAVDNVRTQHLPLTKAACSAYHLPLHLCNQLPSTDTLWYHVATLPNSTFLVTLPATFASGVVVQPGKYINVPKPPVEMHLSREMLQAGLMCVFSAGTCVGYYILDNWGDMIRLMRLGK